MEEVTLVTPIPEQPSAEKACQEESRGMLICPVHEDIVMNKSIMYSKIHIANIHDDAGLILGLRPANERHRYKVTPSLIGWAQT